MLLLLAACSGAPATGPDTAVDTAHHDVPWAKQRPALAVTSPGGRAWKRGIIHLHSHYSHDACDNTPEVDGVFREDCLADFRYGLCSTAMDFAFVTDHPSYAAEQPYQDLLLMRGDDEAVGGIANRMSCADSIGDADHRVLLMPGIEDELMPVGLRRQVSEDPVEADRIYNDTDQEAFTEDMAAGAIVLQAHTEGQDLDTLLARQQMGLSGVELFNLHAMFDPNKREDDLGLDAYGYLDDLAPFITGGTLAEPDLAFLAVYQQQDVSLERWDALNAVAPTIGTGGTDAHENVLPNLASDGERFDSYRRMESWFSNILLVEDTAGDGLDAGDYQSALAAARGFVAFESLGTPGAWDVHYGALEMGGTAPTGDTLVVSCPTLAADSPWSGEAPDIRVSVFKDGAPWQEGCGEWPVQEAAVYRAVAYITPNHLAGFLDDQAATLIHEYPWLYSNALRIGL